MPNRKAISEKERRKIQKYIRSHWPKQSTTKIAAKFGRSKCFIQRQARKIGLNLRPGLPSEMIADIKARYADTLSKKIAKRWKVPVHVIHRTAYRLGLKKSEAFQAYLLKCEAKRLLKAGKKFRFKKGHIPWSKGKKSIHCSPATEFKKGHQPANTTYDGCIKIRWSKTGHTKLKRRPYYWIRLSKAKWQMLSVFVWERDHGKVPKDKIVMFKDRNSLNFGKKFLDQYSPASDADSSNLELIDRTEFAAKARETDEYIAMRMAQTNGMGKGKYSIELYKELLRQPALLQIKKLQLKLQRELKQKGKTS